MSADPSTIRSVLHADAPSATPDGRLSHLQAVVFDWAGTLVDFGSLAPMGAFVRLFQQFGVEISIDEARVPMGLPKWHHIQALGQQPRIAQAWADHHGRPFSDADVDALYAVFTPMSAEAAAQHARLIPGVREVVGALRDQGLKIGSTTGYTRSIMAGVTPVAAEQGLVVDNLVCADDLPQSRPTPFGIYRCLLDLQVWPAHHVVKVDDTVPGLLEGRHAGCWTVGLAVSGNACGHSASEWQALDEDRQDAARDRAWHQLKDAQPDFIIDSVADLLPVLEEIDWLIAQGAQPWSNDRVDEASASSSS
jgi:phosphonoacetaldehyde hydrolase